MKTDDLIAALAADTLPQPKVSAQMLRALPVALAVSLVAFFALWGPRADLLAALMSLAVLKTFVPLVMVVLAGVLVLAQVHPASPQKLKRMLLAALVAVTLAAFLLALLRDGTGALVNALSTASAVVCLLSIPVLALPILGAVLWALASGAAMQPRLTGAVAGLMAGGLGASVYSLYCDKDMVLFVVPAYSAAISFVVLAGAMLGPRLLKW